MKAKIYLKSIIFNKPTLVGQGTHYPLEKSSILFGLLMKTQLDNERLLFFKSILHTANPFAKNSEYRIAMKKSTIVRSSTIDCINFKIKMHFNFNANQILIKYDEHSSFKALILATLIVDNKVTSAYLGNELLDLTNINFEALSINNAIIINTEKVEHFASYLYYEKNNENDESDYTNQVTALYNKNGKKFYNSSNLILI